MQRITLEAELNGIVARLRSERSALLGRFTAKHPDVLKKDEEIARVETLLTRLKSGTRDGERPQSWTMADDPATARIQGQIEAYLIDVDNLTKEQRRLQVEVSQSQGRLRMTPMRERQIGGVASGLRSLQAGLRRSDEPAVPGTTVSQCRRKAGRTAIPPD